MIDDEYYVEGATVLGIEVIPFSLFNIETYKVIVSVGDSNDRKKMVERLPNLTEFVTIIHPSVLMSEWVLIGEGAYIGAGSILTCDIVIGKHSQLNRSTNIGHDARIGNFFTTTPGVVVSGNCTIGDCVYLGTGAVLKEKISITNNVTIGMGGVVVKSIQDSGVYVGNPVKRLLK